jgi:hypothetical protein
MFTRRRHDPLILLQGRPRGVMSLSPQAGSRRSVLGIMDHTPSYRLETE